MSDHPPLITIGITCYNAAATITQAIGSAQDQDWPQLEILIVDDASSDGSVAVVQQKIASDPRCRLILHDRNQGVAAARNTLLAAARGTYIVFFDDDDQSHADRIRTQHRKIRETENQVGHSNIACYASLRRHYPNGYTPEFQSIGSRGVPVTGPDLVAYQLHLPARLTSQAFFGGGTPALSLMISTGALREIGGFDPALRRFEDADMALRLALRNGVFVGCAEVLIEQQSTGGVDKSPEKTLESELYIIEKYKDILDREKQYHFARLWAHMRYRYYCRHWIRLCAIVLIMGTIHPWMTWERLVRVGPARLRHEARMK